MKKLLVIMALVLAVLVLALVLPALAEPACDEPRPRVRYTLAVTSAQLTLTLPDTYELQPVEWNDLYPVPERYEFRDAVTGDQLLIMTDPFDAERRAHLLRKLRENSPILQEGVAFGERTGCAWYTAETPWQHQYLVDTEVAGYCFVLTRAEYLGSPDPFPQAIEILATLEVQPLE